jgi:hypothetical protein
MPLRDRIGPANASHLGAQLPMLLRGLYYEGWRMTGAASKERREIEFLEHITQELRQADLLFEAMKSNRFDVIGSARTYWIFTSVSAQSSAAIWPCRRWCFGSLPGWQKVIGFGFARLSQCSARGEGGPFLSLKQTFVGVLSEFKLSPQSLRGEAANQDGCVSRI